MLGIGSSPAPDAVVYDAQCAFCAKTLRALRRLGVLHDCLVLDGNDPARAIAAYPQLAGADFETAMFAVVGGGVYRGYDAVEVLLRRTKPTAPLVMLLRVPPVASVGRRVYGYVARNRRRFGCRLEG